MIMKTETDMQKLDEEMVTISALTEKLIKENATNPIRRMSTAKDMMAMQKGSGKQNGPTRN